MSKVGKNFCLFSFDFFCVKLNLLWQIDAQNRLGKRVFVPTEAKEKAKENMQIIKAIKANLKFAGI